MIDRMKVTALIPDKLVEEVRQYAGGKTITEALIIALGEWRSLQAIRKLNASVQNDPLKFKAGFSATRVRNLNRSR